MAKYRKKPVEIEAFQLQHGNGFFPHRGAEPIPQWFLDAIDLEQVCPCFGEHTLHIRTLEGVMIARPSDWIIRGIKGELYPCKDEIFRATYEAVP